MLVNAGEAIDAMADEDRKARYADWYLTQAAKAKSVEGNDVQEAKANLWNATNRRARIEASLCRGKSEGTLILHANNVYQVNSGRVRCLGPLHYAESMFAMVDDDDIVGGDDIDHLDSVLRSLEDEGTTAVDPSGYWADIAAKALERACERRPVPADAALGPEFDFPERRAEPKRADRKMELDPDS